MKTRLTIAALALCLGGGSSLSGCAGQRALTSKAISAAYIATSGTARVTAAVVRECVKLAGDDAAKKANCAQRSVQDGLEVTLTALDTAKDALAAGNDAKVDQELDTATEALKALEGVRE